MCVVGISKNLKSSIFQGNVSSIHDFFGSTLNMEFSLYN